MASRRLLLVWHSRTGLARQMADQLERGAIDAAELGARMEAMRALPELLRTVLAQREEIKKMSQAFR